MSAEYRYKNMLKKFAQVTLSSAITVPVVQNRYVGSKFVIV